MDLIIAAIIGALAGALLRPWFEARLDKTKRAQIARKKDEERQLEAAHRADEQRRLEKRELREHRRQQIVQWRVMVAMLDDDEYDTMTELQHAVQRHIHFHSLEPYLSDEAREAVYEELDEVDIEEWEPALPIPLYHLKEEIAKLEKEWELQ